MAKTTLVCSECKDLKDFDLTDVSMPAMRDTGICNVCRKNLGWTTHHHLRGGCNNWTISPNGNPCPSCTLPNKTISTNNLTKSSSKIYKNECPCGLRVCDYHIIK